jgi:ketosteroid isomerase-like protein
MPAKGWAVVALAVALSAADRGRAQSQDESTRAQAEIQQALTTFLIAFNNLDWPAFRKCFAPDVTMFHPAPPNVRRIDSAQEFEKAWLGVFARIRKNSGRDTAPYMNLKPQDLKIQLLSKDIALVTFHFVDANVLSRRTVVLRRGVEGWKIVHIHASNVTMP